MASGAPVNDGTHNGNHSGWSYQPIALNKMNCGISTTCAGTIMVASITMNSALLK